MKKKDTLVQNSDYEDRTQLKVDVKYENTVRKKDVHDAIS